MKKIAVLLSGCGVFDGSEIYETVITLLSIERNGATYQCFAPDKAQMHVVDHRTQDVNPNSKRNCLKEAARLARGEIKSLDELDIRDFDALIVPGGFGAAKNFSNFATNGAEATADEKVVTFCRAFANNNKPVGYMCIAPTLLPFVYGKGVKLTIGNDKATADALTTMGAKHIECDVDGIVFDEAHNIVTTPAYMLASSLTEAASGIEKLVDKVMSLTK
ncbi:isoprenoid biosynthesis glyoxalase ElbB [Aliidiomarina halalkaliphila]|uniref:Glyoxalase n=1 Tax=Aliidiomarina halalkaliphila TaxID=2593535 RepID=A0A552X1M0_9GAMM|nr:isoprenoid biosynthesis glyoxalase ElbB [Aliidiomarina halalkaliphila]TRW48779.1 isoprenoid biosynthesis glyoxalase ElbB [Aliidiomarina halalkaliphila]